ncbi:hypothetical protein UVI_02025010 [Ustilaginoidea virens]|uniref:AB hydrolase-1 domain-containing protein n=1 Tax=Ustilaginoidea virens TaxID=1159556 RepID=A0A063C1X9_USTVR|nr:hypothetical protein UVI_02025010 [Ustilaginoidea virens]
MSGTDKLVPNDPRVQEASARVNGKTYSYILGEPRSTAGPVETVFLIHGFPDSNFGWRYQIPYLMSLGFRVVAPSMLGYGDTCRPDSLAQFSLKSMAADIKALAAQVVGEDEQIILGGHDWGGALVWRVVLWHPELVKAVFAVCTPYVPPKPAWTPLEDLIAAGKLTNFRYQLQLAGPDVEGNVQTADEVRRFLNGMFGATGPDRQPCFTTRDGVLFDKLALVGSSPLLSEDESEYYTAQYMRQPSPPMRGPLNWYRTRRINYEEELPLAEKPNVIEMPALFIAATEDSALPPSMSAGMEKLFKDFTRGEVKASHWALTEASASVNKQIDEWLSKVLNGAPRATLRAEL